jgi:hypothetical protein
MMDNRTLFERDSSRRIDRVIDHFGELRISAIRRTTWLTRRRHPKPSLPAVYLEHPLAMGSAAYAEGLTRGGPADDHPSAGGRSPCSGRS